MAQRRVQWRQRGMVGQTAIAQPGGACPVPRASNVNLNPYSCQAAMCAEQLPVCGCNVIGANTFVLAANGVAASANANLPIDAGDACRYQPRSMLLVAYQADTQIAQRLVAPIVQSPVLMLNATVGTIPMIRRTGANDFGIISDGYSDRKELTCLDWSPFTSVQNQGLTLSFLNIGPNANHIFVILWGDNLG